MPVLLALAALAVPLFAVSQGDNTVSQYEGNPELPMPEFPPDLEWVNIDAPLTAAALRGKVVVLDFWTYGCINCIHMIPVLERLEEKYAEELVVIGVHSAKFENEGQVESIRQIVQRYNIHHPVINDKDFIVWRTYGTRAWPTFVIIDPRGNIIAAQSGEIPFEAFDNLIAGMVEHFDALGEINREPIQLAPEGAGDPGSLLAFPGKVLVDGDGERLFIADSNHHRIVIADLNSYEVLEVIGSGQRGFDDGAFEAVTFSTPQGMALRGNTLYVADTNNHAIRAADLDARTVQTIAGTGIMGRRLTTSGALLDPRSFDLRSPWDVEPGADSTLYIAMAGSHQIWEMNLDTGVLSVSVGNGRESLLNDTLANSELAQPSGMYYTDGLLYFADSESSSIRVADYANNIVRTAAGPTHNTLFDFGDVDGVAGESRLQHALGVTGDPDGLIYVADTYNHKIKSLDGQFVTTTLFGRGEIGGFRDGGPGEAEFDEPGGLDYHDGKLYVADTNNHAIRVIDLASSTVSTVVFPNPQALQLPDRVTVIGSNRAAGEIMTLPEQVVSAGEGYIVLRLALPEGYKLNDLARSSVAWSHQGEAVEIGDEQHTMRIDAEEMRIPVTLNQGEGRLSGDVTIYYCEAGDETLCFVDLFTVEMPLTVGPAGGFEDELTITRTITLPRLEGIGGSN
jgi:thiol-disulfide isomerase/thioredoxin